MDVHSHLSYHTMRSGELDSLYHQKGQVGQSQVTRGEDNNRSLCPQLHCSTHGPQSISCLTPWDAREYDGQEQMPKLLSPGPVATLSQYPLLDAKAGHLGFRIIAGGVGFLANPSASDVASLI